ncbi:MAG: hypothetical protein Q9210_004718 [Variospora velana]
MVEATQESPRGATDGLPGIPIHTPREVSSEESETVAEIIAGHRRATLSTDSSSLMSGISPDRLESPKRKAPKGAGSLSPKRKFVKKGIAQKVVTPRKRPIWKASQLKGKSSYLALSKVKPTAKATQRRRSNSPSGVASPARDTNDDVSESDIPEDDDSNEPSYWLMKAEPNSRFEKGKDVKFSIDDLRNATEPEAWDGVRNTAARSHMRSMLEGDMAFFYHSNCKRPGIVGTMQIVREHSVDETAFDSEHPYYDPKSTREKPKWCVVHVEFRNKFPEMVALNELQKYAKPGGALENLQTLKMSRLSVSKVTKREWDFIYSLVDAEGIVSDSTESA